MLDDVVGSPLDRFRIRWIKLNAERPSRYRMRIGPRADRVSPDIRIREVRLTSRAGFSHERDRAGWRDRRDFVVARCERDRAIETDLLVDQLLVEVAVGLELGHGALLSAERKRGLPRFLAEEVHQAVRSIRLTPPCRRQCASAAADLQSP